jgi:hypothetical protein
MTGTIPAMCNALVKRIPFQRLALLARSTFFACCIIALVGGFLGSLTIPLCCKYLFCVCGDVSVITKRGTLPTCRIVKSSLNSAHLLPAYDCALY